jgi:predicted enzyme related to lactoylglutathione lyase
MPQFTSYAQGTPSYVELSTPDQSGAAAFYGGLFGWEPEESPLPDGSVYLVGRLQGDRVAGISGPMPGMEDHPAYWGVYLAVDDVDATAAKVPDAGGTVAAPPFDVMDFGRMAAVQDPTGAFVNLWQAKGNIGTERANEAGTPAWNECVTPDPERAAAFYADVLGATTEEMDMGEQGTYRVLANVEGRQVAGVCAPPPGGEDARPHWNVYFMVDDADAALREAESLGGRVLAPAFDVPGIGRMAMVADPAGAMFWVMAPAGEPAQP